jgi:hypothetical protein
VVGQRAPPLAFIGLTFDILGSFAFVVFAGRLWGMLRAAEGALNRPNDAEAAYSGAATPAPSEFPARVKRAAKSALSTKRGDGEQRGSERARRQPCRSGLASLFIAWRQP